MNISNQRIALLLTTGLLAQGLLGCASISTSNPDLSHSPGVIESPGPPFAVAQATIDYGRIQQLDLSRKATDLGFNMEQAAHVSALSTQAFNQRQKMDLDYQSTLISMNITQAAATQQFLIQQTKFSGDATAVVVNNNAIATHSANLTRTAQAQAVLDFNLMQTNLAVSAMTSYPLTATPLAVFRADLLMQEYNREQQSFLDKVVAPMVPVLVILDMLLLIPVLILVYRRYWTTYWPRSLRISHGNFPKKNLLIVDGVMKGFNPHYPRINQPGLRPIKPPELPGLIAPDVDIVDAAEPPFAHWIAEAEQQSTSDGSLSP